jgi:hypothetical protein
MLDVTLLLERRTANGVGSTLICSTFNDAFFYYYHNRYQFSSDHHVVVRKGVVAQLVAISELVVKRLASSVGRA